ncbi:DUF2087 domain-containing protein [Anaerocolumna sp. AGMB13020]|uniref:DUF2087 domain-containing protein n=1 Tax=Anaerocolumna sp. AGMB13020 TaxID=3081750 RepID=UPI0029546FF4|nr:DUF2087 domain-containing protein [Anaerocolumna sp. AGMB13020]WOO36103.1 DUF2087 domain-containing protein [Anaerocolumna sp. AGMB13020]
MREFHHKGRNTKSEIITGMKGDNMEDKINNKLEIPDNYREIISQFLDEKQRIKTWPAKKDRKIAVLYYLSEKFEEEVKYTEKEVNEIIKKWHTFEDFFLLRRGLVDMKFLLRARDGSVYWKEK